MKTELICSFFGHRDIQLTEQLKTTVTTEILRSIELGCRIFYFGGFGDFDALCYNIVTEIKENRPELNLKRTLCVHQERYLRKPSPYFRREAYDDAVFLTPSFDGWYKSIFFRNCAMIDNSDIVIFYAENKNDSGAYKAYKYAISKKNKNVINLFPAL